MNKPLISLLFAAIALFSCTGKKDKNEAVEKATLLASKNSVEVISLVKGNFPNQLVSNGKLNALRKSELKFRLSGEIAQVLVKSGEHLQSYLDEFVYKLNRRYFKSVFERLVVASVYPY